LGGIINALKSTGIPIKDHRAVFMGAGSAGVGVAKQIVEYFIKEGLPEDEARRCFWFVDTKVCLPLGHWISSIDILHRALLPTTEEISLPNTKYTSLGMTIRASNSNHYPKLSSTSSQQF
jgi:hypothetical protein